MPDVVDRVRAIRKLDRPRDLALAMLADQQHGVVAVWQMLELGFTHDAIHRRSRSGRLHRIYRGVYAVGHRRLSARARWMASVLACGEEALLSHRAAAALWDLRPIPSGLIDVTAPGRSRRGHDGVRIHAVRSLHTEDCAVVDGIPVTSIHRTLLDYAEISRFQQFRHAFEAGLRQEVLDGNKLTDLIARSRGRHGVKVVKALLAELKGPPPLTRSGLERRFLTLIRDARLPEPQVNVVVEGETVDFFWPDRRLVVEIDSYCFHKSRKRFAADRKRDARLLRAGYLVLRVPEDQLIYESRQVLVDVKALLSAGPGALDGSRAASSRPAPFRASDAPARAPAS